MATLSDVLSDAGIRLKSLEPGRNQHIICPRCGGGNSREVSLSVTIDQDGEGYVATCHRGTCGFREGRRAKPQNGDYRPSAPPKPIPPPPHAESVMRNRPDWLYAFFAERNIGAKTVSDFQVYATSRRFDDTGEKDAIVFPYFHNGQIVNRKYRPYPVKGAQLQERNAEATLYNVDAIAGAETVYWVEGEADAMAMHECGFTATVSLKDGAPSPGQKDDKRYAALGTHEDALKAVKRFVLAGDMDAPGLALREEIARRLGRHRCLLVTWPEGCKDACDVLRAYGPETVAEAINGAMPYPIDGLQTIQPGTMLRLRNTEPPATLTTGTAATDNVLKIPAEGRLIIVSGWPGSGKSAWTRFLMVHTMIAHSRRWAVFSPEMQPWEHYVRECVEVYIRKPFYGAGRMTDQEACEAEEFFRSRLLMLASDAEDYSPSLDWILERARIAVLRDGITDLEIDPWNEIAHERPRDMTETDYIGRSLQRLKAFGLRHGVNIWVVVHPAKPVGMKHGEKVKPVGPYDIASSAHWNNKADLGITLHVPGKGSADLHVWKARFKRFGLRDTKASMDFDMALGIYTTATACPYEEDE